VALIWRWTGDNGFRDEMYAFAKKNLQYVDQKLDVDHNGWPEGSGNVERTGMGQEKLDNAVHYIRALYDLADMARSKNDTATVDWATRLADKLLKQFDGAWWFPQAQQYADSLFNPDNTQNFQKHWIGVTPMEVQLNQGGQTVPGIAPFDHASTALDGRETSTCSGQRPGSLGLFHTGEGGGADGKGDFEMFSLTNGIQAVGEGNYGRLGLAQQRRYTDASAETMFSEPRGYGARAGERAAHPDREHRVDGRGRGPSRQSCAGQLWALISRTAETAAEIRGERCSPSRTTSTLWRCVLTPVRGTRATGRSVLEGVSSGAMVTPHPMPVRPTAVPTSFTEAARSGSKPAVAHSDTVNRPSVSVGQKIHGSSWSSPISTPSTPARR
jgi:hypothetical protein